MVEPLRIYLVEDVALTQEKLKLCLENIGYSVVGMALTGEQALEEIPKLNPDLLVLDIHLEGSRISGIELAKMLSTKHEFPIIYLTSFQEDQLMEDAMSVNAPFKQYLTKPFREFELKAAIKGAISAKSFQKAENGFSEDTILIIRQGIYIPTPPNNVYKKIAVQSIHWVEGDGSSIHIYTTDHQDKQKKYTVSCSLGAFLRQIDHPSLIRIHRSYIVNVEHIEGFMRPNQILLPGKSLPISRTYLSVFREVFPIILSE